MTKAADLRTMASILEDSRLEEEPVGQEWISAGQGQISFLCDTTEELVGVRQRLGKLESTTWEKYATEYNFGFQGCVRGIRVVMWADRGAVCEAIEEEVTELVPDPTVEVPLVEVTRTKITWKCPESLLAEVGE